VAVVVVVVVVVLQRKLGSNRYFQKKPFIAAKPI